MQEWQDAWNTHDLPRILSHYSEDVVFQSRKAVPLMGIGVLCGKSALSSYWAKALAAQPDLHFTVKEVFEGHEMLVILYNNQRDVRVAETLLFSETGLIHQGSACQGN